MRLGVNLYRIRVTNLVTKQVKIHQNASGSGNRFGRQVDPQVDSPIRPGHGEVDTPVDSPVDLVGGRTTPQSTWVYGREFSRQPSLGLNFEFLALFSSCFILFKFLKFLRVITWSYGLRFSKTRTLFSVFFREERNGDVHFT